MKKSLPLLFLVVFVIYARGLVVQAQTVVQWYTSMGDFRAELREDLVPLTAQNFIDLSNDHFYDDFIFHRVIAEFMIQDGCPNGNGTGGPGYTFDDEFHPDLRHDEAGILSMANAGPNTNGSQYFITVKATSWLDDKHSVFGKIIDGLDVVMAISEVETASNDKPLVDVRIDSIRVVSGERQLALVDPVAGTKWSTAGDCEIVWESAFVADVKIEYSLDNGSSWEVITESVSANKRAFAWTAPDVMSNQARIRISDVAHPELSVTSEAFTLCKLDIVSPNGPGLLHAGNPVMLEWESEGVETLSLEYKTEVEGEWTLVSDAIPAAAQSWEWVLPNITSSKFSYRLSETGYPGVSVTSRLYFILFQLALNNPAGSEALLVDSLYTIRWQATFLNEVALEFSADNGLSWELIDNHIPATDLQYEWQVPNQVSDKCFMRLSYQSNPEVFSVNATPFAIVEPGAVSEYLTADFQLQLAPNPVKSQATISWVYPDAKTLTLSVFDFSGRLLKTVNPNVDTRGQWVLPTADLPCGLYFVRLQSPEKAQVIQFVKSNN